MMRFGFASFAAVAAVAQLDTNGSMYVDALKLNRVHEYNAMWRITRYSKIAPAESRLQGQSAAMLCVAFSDWLSGLMNINTAAAEPIERDTGDATQGEIAAATKMEGTFKDPEVEGSELTVKDFVKGGRFEFFGLSRSLRVFWVSEEDLNNGYRPLYAETTDKPDIEGSLKGRFVQRHNKRYSAVDGQILLLLTNNAWHSKLCVVVGEWTYHGNNMLNMVRTRTVDGEEESQNLLEL